MTIDLSNVSNLQQAASNAAGSVSSAKLQIDAQKSTDNQVSIVYAGITLAVFDINGIAFFQKTAGIAQPTITGSRTNGTALTSLLTALASFGLVIDNTSP